MTEGNLIRCVAALLLAAWFCPPAAAGEVTGPDGVPLVSNPAVPADGERTLVLEEVWSVQVEEEETLIGVISCALAGPDGTVLLADEQLGQVLFYSADGEYLRTISREGEGPGEVNHPDQLVWLPNGRLGIGDRKFGQLTCLDRDGTPAGSVHLQDTVGQPLANAQVTRVRSRGGVLAANGSVHRNDADGTPLQVRYFSLFTPDGAETARIWEKPSGFDFGARSYDELQNYFVDRSGWALDARGRVIYAPEYASYRLEWRDASGALVQVVEREFAARKRTGQEKEQVRLGNSMTINGERVPLDCSMEDTWPAIQEIRLRPGGSLWVRHGDFDRADGDDEDHPVVDYDVFDQEGRFREVVHLDSGWRGGRDRLLWLDDGRWILLRNAVAAGMAMYAAFLDEEQLAQFEDAEPLEIVCLREPSR